MQKTKELIKKVKKIEITTKNLVDGLLQGAYHSVFKGRGIEFSDVREYNYGDDVKTIDWNVTARMDRPYIKEFVEERDLTAYIVFDMSASGNFGYEKEKKETALEIAASLIFASQKNNDNIGIFIFTEGIEKFIPARKGRRHAFRIIRELLEFTPKNKTTNIEESLNRINKVLKRRSIIFLISDFEDEGYNRSLKIIKHKNDVIPINIRDIREAEIPDIGLVELTDPETGEEFIIDTSDKGLMNRYYETLDESDSRTKKLFKKNRMEQIMIRSDEDFRKPLQQFFRKRMVMAAR